MSDRELVEVTLLKGGISSRRVGALADAVLAALSAAGRLRAEVTGEVVEAGKLAAEAVNAELCRRLEAGTAPSDTHKLTACMIAIATPIIAADAERRVLDKAAKALRDADEFRAAGIVEDLDHVG